LPLSDQQTDGLRRGTRERAVREQGFLDPAHLVFLDETAVTTNMLRLNGWNPRGERLVSDAPMGHWETVTFIAGLRQTCVVAPMLSATARFDSRRRSFASPKLPLLKLQKSLI
jgi:hypothetical protein